MSNQKGKRKKEKKKVDYKKKKKEFTSYLSQKVYY